MRMTNKTRSQRIGTALPSELPSGRSTEAAIDGKHQVPSFIQTGSSVCPTTPVCVHCGAKISVRPGGRPRALQFILNCLGVVLMILAVLLVVHLLNSWAEHRFDTFFDHGAWHEPLNDWNR
jgi:hypothetical protein